MKDLDFSSLRSKAAILGKKTVGFISRYRTVLTILVASGAIISAVIQAQGYLSPERDENKYTEIKAQVNIKSIDEETLKKLEENRSDRINSVDSNFVPGRDNPFAE